MYLKRTNDNRQRDRFGTCSSLSCNGGIRTTSSNSSKLFQPGAKIIVQRAPLFNGLSVTSNIKPFQRPMLKRRAYGRNADVALKQSSLGGRKRMNGMAKLLARAGRGLTYKLPSRKTDGSDDDNSEDEEEAKSKEPDRPFEPLRVWHSPHNGGDAKGLPPRRVTEMVHNEWGIEEEKTTVKPAEDKLYNKRDVYVPEVLAKWLRPHQREGVQFMYECVMGLKEDLDGNGCILADDMGLGKTLQSVCLIWTLLKTGITANGLPTCKRIIVICPCSLVKNWENEFVKWLGERTVKTLAIAEADRATVEKNLDCFVKTKLFNVLIASYECIRAHVGRLIKYKDCCDLLVCDEAHRLKNRDNQTARALNSLPVKRRVLLTGTPMQNDLEEFYAMADFTNPNILGSPEDFRRYMMMPILRGREPDATEKQRQTMVDRQSDMSTIVNEFILRRVNTLNAQHLPPKLVQVVCCNLTNIQQNMYQHLVSSKDMQHVLNGKQVNCLGSIQMLMKLCNHPSLIAEEDDKGGAASKKQGGRRAAAKKIKYNDDEKETSAAPGADGIAKFMPANFEASRRGFNTPVHPEWSGKMFVLYRLMREMRKPGNGNDKIVIVSNYTQTLDLIGRMCRENTWGFCRLDGSISMKKRQKMVDEFNDPGSSLIAFLLSSKAGGCGLNLIGGNRLVLFDPDWNPAVDKQAAARCWRDGQKKRCFTYRFLATGTVEEKIFQRQLSKEGLQSVVDDKEQVNELSTKDLRNLFKLRAGTPSDTHDKLRCERCEIIQDNAEMEALKKLPKQLVKCRNLLDQMVKQEDAAYFLKPMNPQDHKTTTEEFEKIVKQPMDFGTIRNRIAQALATHQPKTEENQGTAPAAKSKQAATASTYKSISAFSKDVNRIFSNCLKVWEPEKDAVADAARRLQTWWVEQWTELVPILMTMKAEDDEKKPEKNKAGEDDDILNGSAAINNERGDNFQEQLGMPDEENMRSWSHHYSSDTVDDPVFRAAMRGFDAVSFVFGLEVTWSLIQQRQQEEEERKALEELQAVEELNTIKEGDEEEADDDNTDNAKVTATVSTEGSDNDNNTDEKAVVEADSDDEGDDEEDAVAEEEGEDAETEQEGADEMREDEENQATEVVGDEDEVAEQESAAETEEDEESQETEVVGDEDEVAGDDSDMNSEDDDSVENMEEEDESEQETVVDDRAPEEEVSVKRTPSPRRDKESKPLRGMWSCEGCTLENGSSDMECALCGSAKPTPGKKRRRR